MGITVNHALSRERKFFVETESPAGTFVKATTTGAAKILKFDVSYEPERKARMDSRQTRSLLERFTGKVKVGYSLEAEVIPSGTAGTPPDLHQLYYAALGAYANVGATSDTYTPVPYATSQVFRTVSMTDHFPNEFMRSIWGAWVDSFTLSVSGGDTAKAKFEGGAMGYAHTGTSTLAAAMSGVTTMQVQAADDYQFNVNSIVAIDDTTNVQVTAIHGDGRPKFTVGTSVTELISAAVIPYTPDETVAGTPLATVGGSFTVDAVALPILGFEISVKNNLKDNNDEALISLPTDVIPGWLDVSGTITTRARRDFIVHMANMHEFGSHDLALVLGATAGKRLAVDVDYAEYNFAPPEIPDADELQIKLPFVAKGSAGSDEVSFMFY